MVNLKAVLLMTGILFLGTGEKAYDASSNGPSAFRTLYCPECATFVGDEWSTNAQGNCRTCGKPPVEVESCFVTWYGCRGDRVWYDEACPLNRTGKCCSPWTVTILARARAAASGKGGLPIP